MNSVQLVGRLTKDPEIKYSSGDNTMAVARFNLAVDRRLQNNVEQTADFIGIVAFAKTAEFVEKYFKKGQRIGLIGRIQTGNYVNKDGVKVYTTDVIAEQVEFVERKSNDVNSDGNDFVDIPDNYVEDEGLPFK